MAAVPLAGGDFSIGSSMVAKPDDREEAVS